MSRPYLQIRSATGQSRITLGPDPITIGRAPTNKLPIPDDRLSRFHCAIEIIGDHVKLTDLNSRNGTRVNNHKISGTVTLNDGDVIKVGGIEMRLFIPFEWVPDLPSSKPAKPARPRRMPVGEAPRSSLPIPPVSDDPEALAFLKPQTPERRANDDKLVGAVPEVTVQDSGVEDPAQDPDDPIGALGYIQKLRDIVDLLPDQRTLEGDLSLINFRNQIVKLPAVGQETGAAAMSSLLRLLLLLCARTGASDIHVEPRQNDFRIRIRVDGQMVDAIVFSRNVGTRLCSVVKVLSDIDIAQKAVVQEGHFSAQAPDRRIDYRISFTPSLHGQKLVLRVLDLASTPRHIRELGLPSWMFDTIRNVIKQDAGMLIVCGPTGSGKTTTLYAAVRDIDINARNVITIEDPPEYQIDGVTQIPINESQGNTFSHLLRSMLRQDPDVILLGEIRDAETARIAMQAAMTGHLVLTTVHAKNAIGTIFRLLDLGVEPYLVASSLNLVLAQRLVRKLCEHCRVPSSLTPEHMRKLGNLAENVTQIYYPAGCPRCLQTGYHGRLALYELLHVTEDMRDIVLKNPTMQDLRKAMSSTLFTSLRDSGMRLVAEGITSLDEVERVIGSDTQ